MPIGKALLATLYALYVLLGAYSFWRFGVNIIRATLLILALITLFALVSSSPGWTRIVGIVYGAILALVGIVALSYDIFEMYWGNGEARFYPIALPIIGFGAWTVLSLRNSRRSSHAAT